MLLTITIRSSSNIFRNFQCIPLPPLFIFILSHRGNNLPILSGTRWPMSFSAIERFSWMSRLDGYGAKSKVTLHSRTRKVSSKIWLYSEEMTLKNKRCTPLYLAGVSNPLGIADCYDTLSIWGLVIVFYCVVCCINHREKLSGWFW